MTTETQENDKGKSASEEEKNNQGSITLEQALEQLQVVQANYKDAVSSRDKTKEKLRKLEEKAAEFENFDKIVKEKTKLAEQYELVSTDFNNLKNQIMEQKIAGALETAIKDAGAKSVSTVMKLIDKQKVQFDEQGNLVADSILGAVKEVVESDPILFGEVEAKKEEGSQLPGFQDPGVKRAGTSDSQQTAYEKELAAAKTADELKAVLRKYNIS